MIRKYDSVAMSLHWLIAALMIFMLFLGEELMEEDQGAFLPSLHVSIGSAILLLTLLRILWRAVNPPPPLPAAMRSIERFAAKAAHLSFYILLIGLPVTGWLAFPEFAAEEGGMAGVSVFGLMPVPGAPDLGLPMEDLHEAGNTIGIALLLLHVAAALKHHFINRDDTLRRMLPF